MVKRFLAWYRGRLTRRIFLIALAFAVALFAFSQFKGLETLFLGGIVASGVAIMATLSETYMQYMDFKNTITRMEKEHVKREMEAFGQLSKKSCFDEADLAEIKRKNKSFYSTMVLKAVCLFVLIALAMQFFQ